MWPAYLDVEQHFCLAVSEKSRVNIKFCKQESEHWDKSRRLVVLEHHSIA
jgi:hypothetical protein